MDEVQRAAFLNAQTACALIEALGMAADNQFSVIRGGLPIHEKDSFDALIDRYGLGHNAAVTWLTQR